MVDDVEQFWSATPRTAGKMQKKLLPVKQNRELCERVTWSLISALLLPFCYDGTRMSAARAASHPARRQGENDTADQRGTAVLACFRKGNFNPFPFCEHLRSPPARTPRPKEVIFYSNYDVA